MSAQPPVSPNFHDLCWQCNIKGHYAARCPELHHRPPVFTRTGTSKEAVEPGMGRAPASTSVHATKKLSLVQKINMYGDNYLDTHDSDSDDGVLRSTMQRRRATAATDAADKPPPPPPPQATDTPTTNSQASSRPTQLWTAEELQTSINENLEGERLSILREVRDFAARLARPKSTSDYYQHPK